MNKINFFWFIELLLLIVFIIFSFLVFTRCDILGFSLALAGGYLDQLVFSCKNTSTISYIFGAVFLLNSLVIIYLNYKVKVEE